MLVEALAEELVLHHGRERRRHAHRQRERHPLVGDAVERVEERQVALDERLVEPALLEVPRVLRVAHEGKVRVKDEGEVALSHIHGRGSTSGLQRNGREGRRGSPLQKPLCPYTARPLHTPPAASRVVVTSRLYEEGSTMYAVIKTGGKQYRVAAGDKLRVEKLPGKVGDAVTFEERQGRSKRT